MHRKRPVEQADVVGLINPSPVKDVGEYRESLKQNEYFVIPPNWDSPGDSIPLMEFTIKQEYDLMKEIQKHLLEQRISEKVKTDKRTAAMNKMQAALRKGFVKSNHFIRECMEKRQKANRIVEEQKSISKHLQQGTLQLGREKTILKQLNDDIQQTVDAYKHYEIILEEVVKISDIYESSKDCIDRCDALMLAQVEICKLKAFKLKDIERMHKEMTNITKQASLTILGIRIGLAEMTRLYREALSDCQKWEDKLTNAKDIKMTTDVDKQLTIEGLNVIYQLLCTRRGGTKSSVKTVESIADDILREIQVLREVIREVESQEGTEAIDLSNVYC